MVDSRLLELLVCPVSGAPLRYDRAREELIARESALAYPVEDGVPVLLVERARTLTEDELAQLN